MSNQKKGIVPTKKWKKTTLGESWYAGETLISGIGQGFVLTTPLQLAIMTSRIANGIFRVSPQLTKDNSNLKKYTELNVNKNVIEILKKGMIAVTNGSKGTIDF